MTATKTTRMSPMRKHRALAGLAVLLLAAGLTGCATYVDVNFSQTGTHDPLKIHKPIGFIFETRLVRTGESF